VGRSSSTPSPRRRALGVALVCLVVGGASAPAHGLPPPSSAAAQQAAPQEPAREPAPLSPGALRERAEEQARSVGEVGRTFADRLIEKLPAIAAGLVVFALFWLFAGVAGRVLVKLFARAQTDPALAQVALPLARLSILGLGALVAIEQMGFNVGSLLAGVGIAGLAIGLAAQETLANLLAGFALLWDRPFRLGDNVTIAGTFGTVTEIGLRSTRLRTLEQLEVTIPNKEVAQQQIVNHSRYPEIRINVPLAVGYREDLDRVRSVLLEAVAARAEALDEPAPQVVVTALAESAVELELRLWVRNPVPESATRFELLELAKRALDEAGIEIPFPQRTLHLSEPVRFEAGAAPG
jgi:small conductance mechanosensitive channel